MHAASEMFWRASEMCSIHIAAVLQEVKELLRLFALKILEEE